MGAEASDPNTPYINEPTDYQAILKAVDARAAEWKKKYPTYRLAFRSVSTLIAYLDPTTTFKFLQPFVGRRKRDKAVARSEEHTSELQSRLHLVCRLLLEKKKKQ